MQDKEKKLDFISFVVSYILVHILFELFNFHYNIFTDKFNVLKFIIDLGSWILVWVIVSFMLKRVRKNK